MARIFAQEDEAYYQICVVFFLSFYFGKDSVSVNCMKMVWEIEMNVVLPDKIWRTGLSHINSCSTNSRHKLILFIVTFFITLRQVIHILSVCVSKHNWKSNDGTLLHHSDSSLIHKSTRQHKREGSWDLFCNM